VLTAAGRLEARAAGYPERYPGLGLPGAEANQEVLGPLSALTTSGPARTAYRRVPASTAYRPPPRVRLFESARLPETMAVTPHSDLPARRYVPRVASVGLFLVLISLPTDVLLPLLAEYAPATQAADLRQLSGMGLLLLVAGVALCLKGLTSRRDRSHSAVAALGLVVAVVWIALAVVMIFAL
jgi:hypothetical protein